LAPEPPAGQEHDLAGSALTSQRFCTTLSKNYWRMSFKSMIISQSQCTAHSRTTRSVLPRIKYTKGGNPFRNTLGIYTYREQSRSLFLFQTSGRKLTCLAQSKDVDILSG
jgi:hypothetical protein